jgi:hypothetical protein
MRTTSAIHLKPECLSPNDSFPSLRQLAIHNTLSALPSLIYTPDALDLIPQHLVLELFSLATPLTLLLFQLRFLNILKQHCEFADTFRAISETREGEDFHKRKRARINPVSTVELIINFLPDVWIRHIGWKSKRLQKPLKLPKGPLNAIDACSHYLELTPTNLLQVCQYHASPHPFNLKFILGELGNTRSEDSAIEFIVLKGLETFPVDVFRHFLRRASLQGNMVRGLVEMLGTVAPRIKDLTVRHVNSEIHSKDLCRVLSRDVGPRLKSLTLSFCCTFIFSDILSLDSFLFRRLETLSLVSTPLVVDRTVLQGLKQMTNLRKVELSQNALTDPQLELFLIALSDKLKLEELSIHDNQLEENAGHALSLVLTKTQLHTLTLTSIDEECTPEGVTFLSHGVSKSIFLKHFAVKDVFLNGESAKALAESFRCNSSLEVIELRNLGIPLTSSTQLLAGLSCARSLSSLAFLGLFMNRTQSIPQLRRILALPTLCKLDIDFSSSGCREVVMDFISLLTTSVSLKQVSINRSRIDRPGATLFATIIPELKSTFLSCVSLAQNRIDDIGAHIILQALTNSKSQIRVDLSENLTTSCFHEYNKRTDITCKIHISAKRDFHRFRVMEGLDPYFHTGGEFE